jgi:hypothetical protein
MTKSNPPRDIRDQSSTQKAIAALLDALHTRLDAATVLAEEAHAAMRVHEQNQAIGTILALERLLPEAKALFDAAIVLHRGS